VGSGVRARPRGVREVEQLLPGLAAEPAERRPEAVGDLGQAGEPGPGLGVPHGGRPEGGEVTGEEPTGIGPLVQAATEPGLGAGPPGRAAGAPDAARRHLNDRQQVRHRVPERGRIAPRPPAGERPAELGTRHRRLGQQRGGGGDHLADIHTGKLPGEGLPGEAPVEDRLHPGTEHGAVIRGDEVNRGPHEPDAHRVPLGERPGQLGGLEPHQPAPQADVRRVRRLGLQADEVLQDPRYRQAGPVQEQLPGEGCAAQRPAAELVGGGHRRSRKNARMSPASRSGTSMAGK
jgi:hypothetical protein